MWRVYNDSGEWERKKSYLIRSLFEDIPLLSPIVEEQENTSHSLDYGRPESPLPDLVIEVIRKPNLHDESEEFYFRLQREMRRLYEKDFLNFNHSSSDGEDTYILEVDSENQDLNKSIGEDSYILEEDGESVALSKSVHEDTTIFEEDDESVDLNKSVCEDTTILEEDGESMDLSNPICEDTYTVEEDGESVNLRKSVREDATIFEEDDESVDNKSVCEDTTILEEAGEKMDLNKSICEDTYIVEEDGESVDLRKSVCDVEVTTLLEEDGKMANMDLNKSVFEDATILEEDDESVELNKSTCEDSTILEEDGVSVESNKSAYEETNTDDDSGTNENNTCEDKVDDDEDTFMSEILADDDVCSSRSEEKDPESRPIIERRIVEYSVSGEMNNSTQSLHEQSHLNFSEDIRNETATETSKLLEISSNITIRKHLVDCNRIKDIYEPSETYTEFSKTGCDDLEYCYAEPTAEEIEPGRARKMHFTGALNKQFDTASEPDHEFAEVTTGCRRDKYIENVYECISSEHSKSWEHDSSTERRKHEELAIQGGASGRSYRSLVDVPEVEVMRGHESGASLDSPMELRCTSSKDSPVSPGHSQGITHMQLAEESPVLSITFTSTSTSARNSSTFKVKQKRRKRSSPFCKSFHSKAGQTSFSEEETVQDFWKNFFVGAPVVYNVCVCADHVCSVKYNE